MALAAAGCDSACVRVAYLVAAIAICSGCSGRVIYPHPPGEPGTDPGPEITGVTCGNPSSSCEDVDPGSGEPLKAFALVSVRVTVDDLIDPPVRVGPRELRFLHPPLGSFEFRGRDRDLTVDMVSSSAPSATGGTVLFERKADALVGTWVVGMRRGSTRRVHGRYTGTLDGIELPVGHDRNITIELVDFCYPTLRLSSRLHWSWLDGSGSPITLQPAVSVSGCGAGS